jgi:hypothetical protein
MSGWLLDADQHGSASATLALAVPSTVAIAEHIPALAAPVTSPQVPLEQDEPGGLLVAERPVGLVADGVP